MKTPCSIWLGKVAGKRWGIMAGLVVWVVGMGPAAFAGPIAPNEIAGLQAWYRAEGITASGTPLQVSAWNDSSGLGRNMTQTNATYRPTLTWDSVYGFPVVRFDGTNDYLLAGDVELHSNTTGLTVIGLLRPQTVNSSGFTSSVILSKFVYAAGGRAWRLGVDWWIGGMSNPIPMRGNRPIN